jgi:hypothetical protein
MPYLVGWRCCITPTKFRVMLASVFCLSVVHVGVQPVSVKAASSQQQTGPQHFKFKRIVSGRALKKGTLEVSFSRYQSEDGVAVERSVESYRSGQDAHAALEKLTKSASRIIRKGYKNDPDGKHIGTEVELLFEASKDKSQQTVIAWTDRKRVFLLRSQSQLHALDFEQQDYPLSSFVRANQ